MYSLITSLHCLSLCKALEEREFERALHITKENSKEKEDFVRFSDDSTGCLESCYEYRYRGIFRKGFTLLHYAMVYGQDEMVKVLMENETGKQITS